MVTFVCPQPATNGLLPTKFLLKMSPLSGMQMGLTRSKADSVINIYIDMFTFIIKKNTWERDIMFQFQNGNIIDQQFTIPFFMWCLAYDINVFMFSVRQRVRIVFSHSNKCSTKIRKLLHELNKWCRFQSNHRFVHWTIDDLKAMRSCQHMPWSYQRSTYSKVSIESSFFTELNNESVMACSNFTAFKCKTPTGFGS